jgi:molybdenum cofactor cytidylyltransferase
MSDAMPPRPAGVAGLLLAAGRGRRFDASGTRDKLLAPLAGEPVALHAARAMVASVGRCLAVLRPDARALGPLLAAIGMPSQVCADAGLGMGHSLAFGVAALVQSDPPSAIVVALADMPFVRRPTYDRLIAACDGDAAIVAPVFRGERGHPVVFGRAHFAALQGLGGDRGAQALLRGHPVTLVEVDDPGVVRDIDTPADLEPPAGPRDPAQPETSLNPHR